MNQREILDEIRRTAEANDGVPLGTARLRSETGISESDWGKYWPRLSDAQKEAGYAPNEKQAAYDEGFLFDKLISWIREIGRYPILREFRIKCREDSDFPSSKPFRRIGTKAEVARKLINYCREKGGLEDVILICDPVAEANDDNGNPETATDRLGFVYLLESGRHYKIGRTASVGRREYELAIQLPERATVVHEI